MVAVEAPSAPFIAEGQEKVSHSLPSVQDPVPLVDRHEVRLVSATWAINGADGASTVTVWAIHGYRMGPPGLSVQGLHNYRILTFGEGK